MATDQGEYMIADELELYKSSVFFPWSKQKHVSPMVIKEAKGAIITLEDGRELIDLKSHSFMANLGHAHGGMIEAQMKAAGKNRVIGPDTFCEERLKLALLLKDIAPRNEAIELSKVFYCLGGAEANENAIKIARMYTGRHKVITRYRSYHGATLATINFSGDHRRIAVDNAVTGIVRFPDPYPRGSGQAIDTVRLLEEIIEIEGRETVAAILLEGITGSNGVFVPPADYWPRIRELCDKNGIVLIADEVLSGFYRTGKWFGVDHFGVTPDMLVMSKGLTAGYAPLGALLLRQEIAEHFDHETLWCGLTQYGNPLSCATASAAIGFYQSENIGANVDARGAELEAMLSSLKDSHPIIAETRSIGLLAAIDLRKSSTDDAPLVPYRATGEDLKPSSVLHEMLKEEGVFAMVRFSTILIAPPLNIDKDLLEQALNGIDRALKRFGQKLC